MLRIFDSDIKKIGVFHDYNALLGFITAEENQKLLKDGTTLGRGYWAFAEYSPEKLQHMCDWIKPGYLTTVQLKSLEQNLGLLEICRGYSAAVQEVPLNPELNVEEFKRSFCVDYCRQRGWRLIETHNHKSSPNVLVEERRPTVHPYTRKTRLSQRSLENPRGRRLKGELDSCIERLHQKSYQEKLTPIQNSSQKGGV